MSTTIEVLLPKPAAEKLASLKSNPADEALFIRVKFWLVNSTVSAFDFTMAPPVMPVIGGDPLLQVRELRINIGILSARLNDLIDGDEAEVLIEALSTHRLALEREEESVIAAAAANGIRIDRRPNADPRAVLGLADLVYEIAVAC